MKSYSLSWDIMLFQEIDHYREWKLAIPFSCNFWICLQAHTIEKSYTMGYFLFGMEYFLFTWHLSK